MRTGVNIRKRKDGRYEARYPKGRDAAGKLLYGYCYGHSFEEAREKRDRIMAQRPREMNLLILGAGGHGEIIRELAQSLGVFRKIGFLDDDLKTRWQWGGVMTACGILRSTRLRFPLWAIRNYGCNGWLCWPETVLCCRSWSIRLPRFLRLRRLDTEP